MNILNPSFKYVPAAKSDIRKTIKREQKRLEALKAEQKLADEEAARIVTPIKSKK